MKPPRPAFVDPGQPPPPLAPPPRAVPFSLRVRLLFGGFAVFAWGWFAFASLATGFLRHGDLSAWLVFRGELATARGVALGCSATQASEGGSDGDGGTVIYANRYRFEADGAWHEGVSYATGRCLAPGPVAVEYPSGHPETSRVRDMRPAIFGPGVAFAAIFPLVGLGLVGASLRAGRRQAWLLEHGRLALGTLVGQRATRFSLNDRTVWRLRLGFVTEGGQRHETMVRTSRPERLLDRTRALILYDPAAPERAEAWDFLACRPAVDLAGQLEAPGLLGAAGALLLPLVAVAGHVAALTVW